MLCLFWKDGVEEKKLTDFGHLSLCLQPVTGQKRRWSWWRNCLYAIFSGKWRWLALLHCSSWFIGHCKWGIRIDSIATLWNYDSCCSRINQQHQSSIVNEGSVAFACFQNFQQHRFVRLETKACLQIMQTDKNYDLQTQRCYPLY